MEELVISKNEVLVVSSRLFAEGFEIQHKNLLELIKTYQETIEGCFGMVAFETEARLEGQHGGGETKTAYFTEDQAMFIGTLLRNTVKAVQFKVNLVKKFSEIKKLLEKPREWSRKEIALMIIQIEDEKEALKIELDKSKEWFTIKKVAYHNKLNWKDLSWKKLKDASSALYIEPKKVFDSNFPEGVNSYSYNAWKLIYPDFNYNFDK